MPFFFFSASSSGRVYIYERPQGKRRRDGGWKIPSLTVTPFIQSTTDRVQRRRELYLKGARAFFFVRRIPQTAALRARARAVNEVGAYVINPRRTIRYGMTLCYVVVSYSTGVPLHIGIRRPLATY